MAHYIKRDLYEQVTSKILAEMESGSLPWIRPWAATAGANTPCNAVSNRPYSGCNVILLWLARGNGWPTPRFVTYKQATEAGGHVRKGERGVRVIFVKQLRILDQGKPEEDARIVPMLKEYCVFNVAQCDDLPDSIVAGKPQRIRNPDTRDGTLARAPRCASTRSKNPIRFPDPEPKKTGYFRTLDLMIQNHLISEQVTRSPRSTPTRRAP